MSDEQKDTKEGRKTIDALFWGGVLLWAGLVFAAESFDMLPQIGGAGPWSWIFLGAGLYALVGAFYRMSSESYPNPNTWDWIWAGIFIIVGISGFTAIDFAWPLILLLVGGVILVRALTGRE
jgi:hypothetical protein